MKVIFITKIFIKEHFKGLYVSGYHKSLVCMSLAGLVSPVVTDIFTCTPRVPRDQSTVALTCIHMYIIHLVEVTA